MENGYDTIKSKEDSDKNPQLESEYYIQPFTTKKIVGRDWDNFIKSVKLMVRTSEEYKEFINYVKTYQGLKYCSFLGNIDDCEGEVTIEIHHTPLTIHEVIEVIAGHLIMEKKPITTYDIAHITMEEHFLQNVGVVPVSKTMHELIHDGKINVNIDQVFGNISRFLQKYSKGVDPSLIRRVESFIKIGDDVGVSVNKEIFDVDAKVFVNPSSNKLNYQGIAKLLTKKEELEQK